MAGIKQVKEIFSDYTQESNLLEAKVMQLNLIKKPMHWK